MDGSKRGFPSLEPHGGGEIPIPASRKASFIGGGIGFTSPLSWAGSLDGPYGC